MLQKKIRLTAYGMAAVIMVSAVSVNVQAEKLSDILPSAGIGVTLSNGVTLAQIQKKEIEEATQDKIMKLSLAEMKVYLEGQKKAPRTMVSSSVVKKAEVQQMLALKEAEKADKAAEQVAERGLLQHTMETTEATGETVISTVANAASNAVVTSSPVTDNAVHVSGETGNEASVKKMSDVTVTDLATAMSGSTVSATMSDESAAIVSGNDTKTQDTVSAGENADVLNAVQEIGQKAIEATQSISELEAAQAAMLTDEEKEFSSLVIAKVNNYVNVRSDASEEAEIVGKLFDKSVGTYLSEKDGWYEISSGSVTGYVKAEFCVTGQDAIELAKEVGTRVATVTTTTLKVREDASTESAVLGLVPMGEELSVVEEKDGWVKVDIEEGYGWVSMDYLSLRTDFVKAESTAEEEERLAKETEERRKAQEAATANSEKPESNNNKKYNSASSYVPAGGGSASGNAVAQFALQFVGNPYVYGGTSLTNGADCSGFVLSVYKNFGVSLPHSSSADRSVGSAVGGLGEAQPGDLICYSGHVALYIGDNQIVHASTSKTGIIVSRANYRNILAIRRIF